MGSNDLLVKEYLESLKEDTELDYLFPILLRLMKFSIVTTARESKGQSQYGKDIIAIGKDENGIKKRFYFELKGFSDKDITQTSLLKQDGILESIREAKLVAFNDTSIPGFNDLPVQIVVVHNGVIKSDSRLTLEGILSKEFQRVALSDGIYTDLLSFSADIYLVNIFSLRRNLSDCSKEHWYSWMLLTMIFRTLNNW